jgi:excisionase family DNA binding protein
LLGTSPHFVRRLVSERRIFFHKIGKHVRLTEADLTAFVAAGRVEAVRRRADPARRSKIRSRTFGTIRRLPSGRWQARYYDPAGERHTAPQTFPTKADASAHLATVEADMNRQLWIDPRLAQVTLGEWVARWRETTADLRPGTIVLYDYLLRSFLLPAFATTPLGQLDPLRVRTWLAGLHRDGKVTATTIATPPPCRPGQRPRPRHRAGYRGLRQDHGLAAEDRRRPPERHPAGGSNDRAGGAPGSVLGARPRHARFHQLAGTYMNRANFNRLVWRPAADCVGLDGLRYHDLRHTAATLAAAAGATTKELIERMGPHVARDRAPLPARRGRTSDCPGARARRARPSGHGGTTSTSGTMTGKAAMPLTCGFEWSGRRESNPHCELGKLVFCH